MKYDPQLHGEPTVAGAIERGGSLEWYQLEVDQWNAYNRQRAGAWVSPNVLAAMPSSSAGWEPPAVTAALLRAHAEESTGDAMRAALEANERAWFAAALPAVEGDPGRGGSGGGGPHIFEGEPVSMLSKFLGTDKGSTGGVIQRIGNRYLGPTAPPPMAFPTTTQPASPYNVPTSLDGGGTVGFVGGGDPCQFLPEGPLRTGCRITMGIATVALPGGNRGGNLGGAPTGNCPTGYKWDGSRCEAAFGANMGGAMDRGAQTGTGMMNIGALPDQVGTIRRKDGTTGPIMRCSRGWVLGMDYLCYPKQMLPRTMRAHPPGTKPLLTGGDVRILSRARSLEKKVKKLSTKYTHKPCSCSGKTRRKK